MNINPTGPNGARPGDSTPLEGNRAAETRPAGPEQAQQGQAAAKPRGDSVDVSADAKALAEGVDARTTRSSLAADRLKEIGERIATDYYNRREVIDVVAQKLADDPNFRSGTAR